MTNKTLGKVQERLHKRKTIARAIFYIILSIVIISELMFAIIVDVLGNGDILISLLKTIGIIIFSLLVYRGFKWAKWILGIFCFIYALAMILSGIENEASFENGSINIFYALSGVFITYGVSIFLLPKYIIGNKTLVKETS